MGKIQELLSLRKYCSVRAKTHQFYFPFHLRNSLRNIIIAKICKIICKESILLSHFNKGKKIRRHFKKPHMKYLRFKAFNLCALSDKDEVLHLASLS